MKLRLSERAWPSVRDPEEIAEEERFTAHEHGDCIYMDECRYCEEAKERNARAMMKSFSWALEQITRKVG
jgi:hypothetical protein